jgi:dTDP-4-amino-4,6-dideoxygalactose transaminase
MLEDKRKLALAYEGFFKTQGIDYITEPPKSKANFWLNAVVMQNRDHRDAFLKATNDAGVMTRPIWQLMTRLTMFQDCQTTDLANSYWLEERVVNIPSGVRF